MNINHLCNKIIEYSFYSLFFFVPLVFTSDNSELFELTKMWLTWGITVIIVGTWITKMIANKNFQIKRTPLDIPILLFFLSQVISTLISLDQRVSLWGYYSRFNGGLLSTISYILLYYAASSNLTALHVWRLFKVSIVSAFLVCLWGLPSRFGADPTCFVVRGTFDISCWTDQFVPTARIFSTLGQPAWMAAYLSTILPVTLAFYINHVIRAKLLTKTTFWQRLFPSFTTITYALLAILFYISLIFTNTRAGFLAFVIGFLIFFLLLLSVNLKKFLPYFTFFLVIFTVSTFIFGIPITQLQPYTIGARVQESIMRIINTLPKNEQSANSNPLSQKEKQAPVEQVANITDSGNIRKNVWKGAITAWKHHPIFGTGVETFAFAYYKYKPPEQNLVTEWDYLYNKAHNEYLNYAATTGTFGIVTYLFFIGYFLILSSKWLLKKGLHHLTNLGLQETEYTATQDVVLIIGIVCGFITILVSNFFGFSVVITNLYLFLIPIFVFLLMQRSNIPAISSKQKIVEQSRQTYLSKPSSYGWAGICIIWIICIFILLQLYQFWIADKKYALGYNLNRINRFQEAYILLSEAVNKRGSEPVFQDELAYSSAMLAREFAKQNDTVNASKYAKEALAKSDSLFTSYPNNVVFLKNRVRTLYALGEIDPQFIGMALQTILKAYEMAPNDAKIGYNAGLLLGQAGQVQQGIDVLERIKRIKPDFRDVYFALGIFYRDLATAGEGKTVKDPILQKKAEDNMRYILQNLNPNDKQVLDYLSSWGVR